MAKWIIHADDFGETDEITRGIVLAMEAGSVSSTSIMANMPGTSQALDIAKSWDGPQSFGVHLNFCEGQSLVGPSSLTTANGTFLSKKQLFARSVAGNVVLDDAILEVRAQIDRVGSAGIKISHVDSHKHLHQLPVIRIAVAEILAGYGIDRIRVTRETSVWRKGQGIAAGASRIVRNLMAASAAKHFSNVGLRSPSQFLDITDIQGQPVALRKLRDRNFERSIIEIGCHPGTDKAVIEKPGSCDRSEELRFLISNRFKDILKTNNATLATYWEV